MRTRLSATVALLVLGLSLDVSLAHAQAATSVCKDGTRSSVSGRGACSGHGGVNTAATKAVAAAAAQVTCTDGTMSKAGRGACARHGGIKGSVATATRSTAPKPPAARKPVAPSRRNDANDPTGATAQCKDGTYSRAATHRGACSRNGGVGKFLKP